MNATIQKQTMNPDYAQIANIILAGLAALGGGWLTIRKFLSKDSVDRAGNQADIGTINRLNKLLDEERKARREAENRADKFAHERNEAIQRIGSMEGQITALTGKVEMLQQLLERYVKT